MGFRGILQMRIRLQTSTSWASGAHRRSTCRACCVRVACGRGSGVLPRCVRQRSFPRPRDLSNPRVDARHQHLMFSIALFESTSLLACRLNGFVPVFPPRPGPMQRALVLSLAPPVHRDKAPQEGDLPRPLPAGTPRCSPIRRCRCHAHPWNAKPAFLCPKIEWLGYRKLSLAPPWKAMTNRSAAPVPRLRKRAPAFRQTPG